MSSFGRERRSIAPVALVLLAAAGLTMAQSVLAAADLVLLNGTILTMDGSQRTASAIAVEDGVFSMIGTDDEVRALVGADTDVVDLAGGFVMPGLHDAHLHPIRGGLKDLYECSFPFAATPEEVASAVARCVAEQPDAVWIRGGQWDSGFFDRFEIASPREFLDRVSGDKAVILNDDSNHNGWANSRALELAGITADTPDPSDGTIVRDGNGVPNGVLLEGAEQGLSDMLPPWSVDEVQSGALRAVEIANRFGVVGLKDANTSPDFARAYFELDQAGRLTTYVAASLQTPYGARSEPLDLDALDALRHANASTHVMTDEVKLYLDGVPTSSRTAAMLADYRPDSNGGETHSGYLHLSPERLAADVVALDARGYTVKIHAAGDRSVRVALDAIAAARAANSASSRRHEIAHAGYIDPTDVPRFNSLDAVADLSPYLWHPSGIIDSIISAVGEERGEHYWPIRDLIDSGAPLLAGSDWPAAVETMNPWLGIEAMVTRAHPNGARDDYLWPEQKVRLLEALTIMTLDGAAAIGVDDVSGSISLGKSADMIVLDRDLLKIPATDISEVRVMTTYFAGKRVFKRETSKPESSS